MSFEKYEDYAILSAAGIALFIAWRSGGLSVLNSTLNNINQGKIGTDVANITINPSSVKQSGAPITFGQVVVESNPITFIPNLIRASTGTPPIGAASLNLSKTDAAFAKIGMTTAEFEKLMKLTPDYAGIEQRLIAGTATASDKALLYQAGWDGTTQW